MMMTTTVTTVTTMSTIRMTMMMTEAWTEDDVLQQGRGPTMMTMTIVMNMTATVTIIPPMPITMTATMMRTAALMYLHWCKPSEHMHTIIYPLYWCTHVPTCRLYCTR